MIPDERRAIAARREGDEAMKHVRLQTWIGLATAILSLLLISVNPLAAMLCAIVAVAIGVYNIMTAP